MEWICMKPERLEHLEVNRYLKRREAQQLIPHLMKDVGRYTKSPGEKPDWREASPRTEQ